MSNLRDKFENHEVTPPANTWEKIAAALDEAHQTDQFPARLHAMEINPPATVWDKINTALDETEHTDQFPARLYSMEVTPPAAAWNKIAKSLDQEQDEQSGEAIVINQPSRFKQYLRYAAAAIVIGAVAFGILRWTSSSSDDPTGPSIAAKPAPSVTAPAQTAGASTASAVPVNVVDEQAKTVSSEKQIAKLDRSYKTTRRVNPDVQSAVYNSSLIKPRGLYTYNDHVPSLSDRYIMLMTPDGNFIRMSKKWGNLVCCVSGEDPDADCKDQLKKWQEKMATSALTTSAGNFIDILQLVNSLDEGSEL
jgi:negative regulator of sigma E activity